MIELQVSNRTVSSASISRIRLFQLSSDRCLLGGEEAGADVRAGGAQDERRREPAPVRDPAGGEHRDRRHRVDDLGDERHRTDPARHALAARLAPLCDHDVDPERGRLARLADRVHLVDDLDARRMRPLDQAAGVAERERHTRGPHVQRRLKGLLVEYGHDVVDDEGSGGERADALRSARSGRRRC